jgi:methionyl-tRNA synthetase
MADRREFYITTPIYYVNGEPHLGHVFATLVADAIARTQRMRGRDVLFTTGTDEHAAKVVEAAAAQGLSAQQLADRYSELFQRTFERLGSSHDDFIRTTQERHKRCVRRLVADLAGTGDVYLGEYEGWYDAGQEEYVPENRARECEFRSPVNGRPLVRRREQNYFFRLSAYQDALLAHLDAHPEFVEPAARRNEVLARIRAGLNDVPITRSGGGEWGIGFPGDESHLIYVWIDALINYVSLVDDDARRRYWPADVHLIGKDILWFHAVIWPAMLMAAQRSAGNEWLQLPRTVYAHSVFTAEGQKMSKSLGNSVDLARIDGCIADYGLDAFRWFLLTQGPLGSVDSDYSDARLREVYNADLANTVGNCWNRIANMTQRYLGGRLPGAPADAPLRARAEDALRRDLPNPLPLGLDGLSRGLLLIQEIDQFIEATAPFRLARDPARRDEVASILYQCAETYRIASLWLWPALPQKMEEVWRRLGIDAYARALAGHGRGERETWSRWGGLPVGSAVAPGDPLFPRRDM